MAEWTVCPHCHLKHTRRPDGACPRCKHPADGGETSAPAPAASQFRGTAMPDVYDGRPTTPMGRAAATSSDSGGAPPSDAEVSTGARIAGAVMLVNGLLVIIEKLMMGSGSDATGGGMAGGVVSIVLDFLVGSTLLMGQAKYLGLAKVRIALGLVAFTALHMFNGNPVMAICQIVFSTGLVLLVFGKPGIPRIAIGAGAASLVLVLEVLGLLGVAVGGSFLRSAAYSGQLESTAATVVQGEKYQYHLTPSSTKWFVRKAEYAHKDNALADRWLVRPDKDAHIFVIGEKLQDDVRVDMDRFADVIAQTARRAASKFTVVATEPLSTLVASRLLEVKMSSKGQNLHGYYGLFAREPYIYQVIGLVSEQEFSSISLELKESVSSFELD